jgi:hypothetical protein
MCSTLIAKCDETLQSMWNNLKDSDTKVSLDGYEHITAHNYTASPLTKCIAARCSECERVEKRSLHTAAERKDDCLEIDRLGQCGIISS